MPLPHSHPYPGGGAQGPPNPSNPPLPPPPAAAAPPDPTPDLDEKELMAQLRQVGIRGLGREGACRSGFFSTIGEELGAGG